MELADMAPDTAECAAIHIKRLADCTGEQSTALFEKLIDAGSITEQNASEMAQYFHYTTKKKLMEQIKIGKYKTNKHLNVRTGTAGFSLNKDTVVEVTQLDTPRRKVLIDFGDRLSDWFPNSWLEANTNYCECTPISREHGVG